MKLVFQNCLSFGKSFEDPASKTDVLVLSKVYLKFFTKEYKAARGKFVIYDEVKRKKRERSESALSDRNRDVRRRVSFSLSLSLISLNNTSKHTGTRRKSKEEERWEEKEGSSTGYNTAEPKMG